MNAGDLFYQHKKNLFRHSSHMRGRLNRVRITHRHGILKGSRYLNSNGIKSQLVRIE
jgi:hypothetical protein